MWNETFKFNVINENSVSFTIKDEDTFKDDVIGTGHLQLAKARERGADRMQVPVMSKDGRKQHGHMQVRNEASSARLQDFTADHPILHACCSDACVLLT